MSLRALLVLVLLQSHISAISQAAQYDLNGIWIRGDGQRTSIKQTGSTLTAIKLEGGLVPAGAVTWEGAYDSNSFSGRAQVGNGRGETHWVPVHIKVLSSNKISVTGSNINNIYTRASADSLTSSGVRFSRPSISGIRLNQQSLDLLKQQSETLRDAHATKSLLAWSPLMELIGENNAVHAAFSINQTNWEELAKSFSAVDKTAFYSLATQSERFANSEATWGNPQLKQFWNAMADFYASQAQER